MKAKLGKLTNKRTLASALFWTWNVIFLAFMALGFAPTVLPEMLTAVQSGEIPTSFILYAIILTLIPALAVILGLTVLRGQPERLFALGYGVEGPLMILLALRFFLVRQMIPPVAMLLLVAGVGILVYLWQLLDTHIDERSPILALLRLIGLTCLLLTGIYASIVIAFYALPLGVQGILSIDDFFREMWRELTMMNWSSIQWRMVPFTVLGITIGIYSATLVVLMPIAVSILYIRAWWRGIQAVAASYNRPRAIAISVVVIILIIVSFIPLTRQPQQTAFALLETPPASIDEAEALLAQQETIRTGLLNAYLAPQRYFSAVGEVRHIREIYRDVFDLSQERATQVQRFYEAVTRPMLYNPVTAVPINQQNWGNRALTNEPPEAAALYEQFFDTSIVEGEHDAVIQAVRSTWNIDQARANWLAVDDREIYLTRQEVTVTEHGDWAEMELYEVYENQTTLRQEVIYYFSLPETAVITGVWLGNSDDRDERFSYIVAPRGAAQSTYRREVRRNLDPALVEQIGPSQYRLRVFPIEPQMWGWDDDSRQSTLTPGPAMHLWLTWQVLGTDSGWPLPYLAQKRNVYWDDDTVRLLNGAAMEADETTWLPAFAATAQPIRPAAHRVDFPGGQTVIAQPATTAEMPVPANAARLAVVLDRSRSMAALSDEVTAALTEIGTWGTAVDVYLTASPIRGEAA
ncbi:MAG: TIGR02921 family PEP-CTERM protein, partial [Anaerolineales bacterium]|nr:TIGR02921 family PEP-CTERM protein [Anaerolineales bacterium]